MKVGHPSQNNTYTYRKLWIMNSYYCYCNRHITFMQLFVTISNVQANMVPTNSTTRRCRSARYHWIRAHRHFCPIYELYIVHSGDWWYYNLSEMMFASHNKIISSCICCNSVETHFVFDKIDIHFNSIPESLPVWSILNGNLDSIQSLYVLVQRILHNIVMDMAISVFFNVELIENNSLIKFVEFTFIIAQVF